MITGSPSSHSATASRAIAFFWARYEVGAAVDQQARHLRPVVDERRDERRDVVGVADVDVGAGVEEDRRDLDPAVARRVVER
jgi:hypothetical protein